MESGLRLGVMGLGAMGSRMARRWLEAGAALRVHNRSPQRADALLTAGAQWCASPAELATTSEVIVEISRDDASARALWEAALPGIQPGTLAISASTLTPQTWRELAAALRACGAVPLDAPVVGSRPQAEAGALVHLVGGDAAAAERAAPLLAVSGKLQHHAGGVGDGMALKLAVNAFFGVQVAALAELLMGLERAGLDSQSSLALLGALPVTAPAMKGLGQLMLEAKAPPLFPIELVAKDLAYAAEHLGPAPMSARAAEVYAAACEEGLGGLNIQGVVERYRGARESG